MGNSSAIAGCSPSKCECDLECEKAAQMAFNPMQDHVKASRESDVQNSQAMLNHLLLRAAEEGSADAIIACIERGAFLETRRPFAMSPDGDFTPEAPDVGLTPLMYASQSGSIEACQALLKFGADVNAEDEEGHRALHLAAMSGSASACQLLLRFRADPQATDLEDRVALDLVPAAEKLTRVQQEAWKAIFAVQPEQLPTPSSAEDALVGGGRDRPPADPNVVDREEGLDLANDDTNAGV